MRHSLLYNGQFTISLVPLAVRLLKLSVSQGLLPKLNCKFLCDVIFSFISRSIRNLDQWSIYNRNSGHNILELDSILVQV